MLSSIGPIVLALTVTAGGPLERFFHGRGQGYNTTSGPGSGFPEGNPDGYGYFDHGTLLPLGANRTPEYYFPRYFATPPNQLYFPTYYNPYLSRGQRYLPYVNCGGDHPAGGPPPGSAAMPYHTYDATLNTTPSRAVPRLNGRVEAPPINPGTSGLRP